MPYVQTNESGEFEMWFLWRGEFGHVIAAYLAKPEIEIDLNSDQIVPATLTKFVRCRIVDELPITTEIEEIACDEIKKQLLAMIGKNVDCSLGERLGAGTYVRVPTQQSN